MWHNHVSDLESKLKISTPTKIQLCGSLALLLGVTTGLYLTPCFAQNNFSFTPKNKKPDKLSPELKAALVFYKNRNYHEASKRLEILAQQGDAVAARYLGSMYEDGLTGKQDLIRAEHWLRKAALKNDVEAQLKLAGVISFRTQENTEKASNEINYWLIKAADQGSIMAQAKMGARYGSGKGIKQNLALSFKYREMAALQGDEKAALKAGRQAFLGEGIAPDPARAVILYKRAATSYPEACRRLSQIYKNGAKGIAPDPAAAKMWKKKAAALEKSIQGRQFKHFG
jgi:TPR repeat protein